MEDTPGISSLESFAHFLGVDSDCLVGGVDLGTGARLLGIAASTLRLRALRGEVGYQRDGRRWIFTWQDLLQYVERRRSGARASEPESRAIWNGDAGLQRGNALAVEEEARRLGLL